jgi:16S rRNA A1518/A1519 N6-dimethyltransferase RsmA/KsgA/DIM1 with predicted DNA glycosylase/AP lyase activity
MAQELRDLAARTKQAERVERERQAKQLAEITAYLHNIGHLTGVQAPQFTPPPQVFASPVSLKANCFDSCFQ